MSDDEGLLSGRVSYRRMPAMESEAALGAYFHSNGWDYKSEGIYMIRADQLREEFKQIHEMRTVDCAAFLAFWNMVGDIAYTLKIDFYGDEDEITPTYDKVFYGNNFPAVRKDREWYTPVWNDEELEELEEVFRDGLKVLRAAIGS